MQQYQIDVSTGKFTGAKPEFTHTETLEFEAALKNADGTAFDLTGYSAQCAMKKNWLHRVGDQLIAYAVGTITDPETGVIAYRVECRSSEFYKMVRYGGKECNFEISLIRLGQTESNRIALDSVKLHPRVQADEGPIPESDSFSRLLRFFGFHDPAILKFRRSFGYPA